MADTSQKITYTSTPEQIEAMHSTFDEALARFASEYGNEYPIVINGEEITIGYSFDVVAPADTRVVLGKMQVGSTEIVDKAVAASRAGYAEWSGRPWQERVAIIQSAAETVRERKFDLAAIMIQECGKSRTEAIGEVEEGADLLDYYAKQMVLADGFVLPMDSIDPREHNQSVLRPFGVWAILSPFNFPDRKSVV